MKKFFIISLAVLLVLSCSGCAKKEEKPSAGIPNPMVETDADGIMEKLGLSFNVPEGVKDVKYFIIADELAQMQFTLEGDVECCARIKPSAEFEDISGMFYEADIKDKGKVGYSEAEIYRVKTDGKTIDICLWYDVAPGLMYSVSAEAKDLDGFDIQAIAEQTYVQTQGDVG